MPHAGWIIRQFGPQITLFGRSTDCRFGDQVAIHIGGYRLSSGTQRKLQSVTGVQWLRTPDRRLRAADSRWISQRGSAQIALICAAHARAS
jgi:hypothetical protein